MKSQLTHNKKGYSALRVGPALRARIPWALSRVRNRIILIISLLSLSSCATSSKFNIVGTWEALDNNKIYRIVFQGNGNGSDISLNESGSLLYKSEFTWRYTSNGLNVSEYIGRELESVFYIYKIRIRKDENGKYLDSEKRSFNYYRKTNV